MWTAVFLKTFSFTKGDRIRKRSEYQYLSQYGNKVQNPFFIGLYKPNSVGSHRLGITVSKKVGNAVIRNTIKRYCREYFRLNRPRANTVFCDINIIARRKASELTSVQAYSALQHLFTKLQREMDHSKIAADRH